MDLIKEQDLKLVMALTGFISTTNGIQWKQLEWLLDPRASEYRDFFFENCNFQPKGKFEEIFALKIVLLDCK